MSKGIFGKKLGMTQIFDDKGNAVPVTVVQAEPCVVVRKKSPNGKDGYAALVVGFGKVRTAEVDGKIVYKAKQPHLGIFSKAGLQEPKRYLKEIRIDKAELDNYQVGDLITVDIFGKNSKVDVVGKSKGRGFAGVMKRHNMAGAKSSHGSHEYFRHGGSIGSSATPGRVMKGKKMAGHYGNERVTVQNLRVFDIDTENHLIMIKGPIPGPKNGWVFVQDAVKRGRA